MRELDPTRVFWPSSPCGGPGDYSDCWHDDSRGDMHSWEVWHEGKPFERYLELKPRFCSEFGYQSFPSVEGIRTYAAPDEFNVTSPVLEHHQRHPRGNSIITENMTRYIRFPEGFENFVYLSQVQQAIAIKTAVEHFRSLRPVCMGAIYWQLNDLWPVCSWSSLEYGGKWKLLHYAARRFFAPVAITAKLVDGAVEVYALNDELKPLATTATVRVIDFSGKVRRTLRWSKRVPANSTLLLKKITLQELGVAPDEAFLALELRAGGRVYRNELIIGALQEMRAGKNRALGLKVAAARNGFAVTLTTDVPTFWVRLDVAGVRGEFDDNGFTLLPGEPRRVVFTPKGKLDLAAFRKKTRRPPPARYVRVGGLCESVRVRDIAQVFQRLLVEVALVLREDAMRRLQPVVHVVLLVIERPCHVRVVVGRLRAGLVERVEFLRRCIRVAAIQIAKEHVVLRKIPHGGILLQSLEPRSRRIVPALHELELGEIEGGRRVLAVDLQRVLVILARLVPFPLGAVDVAAPDCSQPRWPGLSAGSR